jgi:hypothetical protein
MTTSRVKHPILRLDVLASDGTRTSEHRVFCRLQRTSVQVEHCCGCIHCDAITEGETPSVDCSIPVTPFSHADDPAGESVEVAALLSTGTLVLAESAAVGRVLELLADDRGRRSVAVVDAACVLVGVVHEAQFIGGLAAPRSSPVSSSMSGAIAVHECTPVRVALKLLAASHLREVTVVSKEGVPLGVFRDVDGLRWIAGTR